MLQTLKNYFVIKDEAKLKTSELLAKCREKFPVWSYLNDAGLDTNFPIPKEATTRYFKKTVEADENLKNLSANDLEKKGIKGITIRERIIMELQYFEEMGKHLDIDNLTLCSGSRYADGGVPRAYWDGDEFHVCWYYADYSDPSLRAREAVSLNPLPLITYKVTERLDMGDLAILDGDKIRKAQELIITGSGTIMDFIPSSVRHGRRKAFLGAYATREEAEKVVEEIRNKYGKK